MTKNPTDVHVKFRSDKLQYQVHLITKITDFYFNVMQDRGFGTPTPNSPLSFVPTRTIQKNNKFYDPDPIRT